MEHVLEKRKEREKEKKNRLSFGPLQGEHCTVGISIKIEPSLKEYIDASGLSVRQLLWRGVHAEEGDPQHVAVVAELREEQRNMKATLTYVYKQVDLLLRERADRLRHKKAE